MHRDQEKFTKMVIEALQHWSSGLNELAWLLLGVALAVACLLMITVTIYLFSRPSHHNSSRAHS